MSLHEGMPIFLVIGVTGEYEDHHEWVVCAYRDIQSAHEHAKRADEEAKKIFQERPKENISSVHKTVLDESMHIDYTGTHYYVEEVVLHPIFRT